MPEPKILAVRLSGDEIHARMFKATVYEIFRLDAYQNPSQDMLIIFAYRAYLPFRGETTHTLEMRSIVLIESLKLTRQREGGVIIVPYMLIIFGQVLESW
jgi:hypothetical protein